MLEEPRQYDKNNEYMIKREMVLGGIRAPIADQQGRKTSAPLQNNKK